MKKSISKNYIYNLSYQLLTLLTPFITTPYISRVLGADGIGIYSYTTSIVSYFILLASLGIASYAQREIAYHQENQYIQSRIFYEVFGIRLLTVTVSLLSYYVLLSNFVHEHPIIYWVQALNILAVLFDISWFFQGLEDFAKIVFRNFIIRILNIVGIFLLIHSDTDLLLYIGLMSIMNVLGGLSIWLYLPKYLVCVAKSDINIFRNFKIIIQLFLPQMAIQIYTVFDKTMIGVLTASNFENGYYEQAEKICKMLLMLVTSLGPVMMPRIAAAYAHNDKEAIKHYIMRSYRFVWMIGLPMMFVTIGLIDTAVPWFFGPGYEKVGLLVKVFSGLLLAIGINNVTGVQYLISVNKQNIFTLTVLLGALINFCLNMILIPTMESTGAAIASVAAETAIALAQFYFVREYFSLNKVLQLSKCYLLCSLLMFAFLMMVSSIYNEQTVIYTVALGGLSIIVYSGLLILFRDDFFMGFLNKIIGKVREKL